MSSKKCWNTKCEQTISNEVSNADVKSFTENTHSTESAKNLRQGGVLQAGDTFIQKLALDINRKFYKKLYNYYNSIIKTNYIDSFFHNLGRNRIF